MGWRKYPYIFQSDKGFPSGPLRPWLEVILRRESEMFRTVALVDSGCDYSMIRPEISDVLGIKKEMCKPIKIGGVGGDSTGFKCEIAIEVPDFEPFPAAVTISDKLPVEVILGQEDFFLQFDVCFERGKKIFKIKPI